MTKAKSQTSSGNSGGGTNERIVEFYSAGGRSTQPLFSDLKRNFYSTIDLLGNPFFTGTQPSGASSTYDYNRMAVDVSDYFAGNLFGAYEYYRVKKIETTFTWASPPENGLLFGDLYTSLDKDSREAENSNAYINRRNLQKHVFTNDKTVHTVSYKPHMVDFVDDSDIDFVKYVQPVDRWWNAREYRNHRWGCLRFVVVSHGSTNYTNNPSIFVTHRVWIEMKGQMDVLTPSVPPSSGLGHQIDSGSQPEPENDSEQCQSPKTLAV